MSQSSEFDLEAALHDPKLFRGTEGHRWHHHNGVKLALLRQWEQSREVYRWPRAKAWSAARRTCWGDEQAISIVEIRPKIGGRPSISDVGSYQQAACVHQSGRPSPLQGVQHLLIVVLGSLILGVDLSARSSSARRSKG